MSSSLTKKEKKTYDDITELQGEVFTLQSELTDINKRLEAFEAKIYLNLQQEITRVRQLTATYKARKAEKKAKRLEQKKKGKNYKEPKTVLKRSLKPKCENTPSIPEQNELKRLYKQTIIHIHPDKINHEGDLENIKQYTQMTAQLNQIYKSGDLEELISFYQMLVKGHRQDKSVTIPETMVDAKARLTALKRGKAMILKNLEDIKTSYVYQVLSTYENPLAFIQELKIQFQEKIKQLEKRTKMNVSSKL